MTNENIPTPLTENQKKFYQDAIYGLRLIKKDENNFLYYLNNEAESEQDFLNYIYEHSGNRNPFATLAAAVGLTASSDINAEFGISSQIIANGNLSNNLSTRVDQLEQNLNTVEGDLNSALNLLMSSQIEELQEKINILNNVDVSFSSQVISNKNAIEEIQNSLSSYASSEDLNKLKDLLSENYAKTSDIEANYQPKGDYATSSDVTAVVADLANYATASDVNAILGIIAPGTVSSFYSCNNDHEEGGEKISTPVVIGSNDYAGKFMAIQGCAAWAFQPTNTLYGYDSSKSECTPALDTGQAFALCLRELNLAPATIDENATKKVWSCTTDQNDENVVLGEVVATGGSTYADFITAVSSCANMLPLGQSGKFTTSSDVCSDLMDVGQAFTYCLSSLAFSFSGR